MGSYLDRYLQGECEQVWAELLAQEDAIQESPLCDEALAVTRETMMRVRNNISLMVAGLHKIGYIFGHYPNGGQKVYGYRQPINLPAVNISKKIAKYEKLPGIGSFPLSLRMFWEIVGDVDFTGFHPAWPPYSDPLVVFPIDSIKSDYSAWIEQVDDGDVAVGDFLVPLAPDYYHKENVSGGPPYGIRVPCKSIDAIFENEPHGESFVEYLRISFRYGGFPGHHWYDRLPPAELQELSESLQPI